MGLSPGREATFKPAAGAGQEDVFRRVHCSLFAAPTCSDVPAYCQPAIPVLAFFKLSKVSMGRDQLGKV